MLGLAQQSYMMAMMKLQPRIIVDKSQPQQQQQRSHYIMDHIGGDKNSMHNVVVTQVAEQYGLGLEDWDFEQDTVIEEAAGDFWATEEEPEFLELNMPGRQGSLIDSSKVNGHGERGIP
ncbi:hypothetical protein SUNI508_08774 [Seiridium unicorne]|uniref:Uncharacterized protein n=1 Tax=Seiridium unicorne TaxID=138068 RepID=A0ABR2USB2_9PEZI